ncbi:hypothetical protein [Thioalkalivibrio sp. HK1]|uniref:hypothetical protein n=1 Tax=Thioalkalivibrio sp. HK1 TaxID=1469245 RepID=UPI0018CC0A7C|nr:hypothetical protein [Thioalkalivibrio sp. HK1]
MALIVILFSLCSPSREISISRPESLANAKSSSPTGTFSTATDQVSSASFGGGEDIGGEDRGGEGSGGGIQAGEGIPSSSDSSKASRVATSGSGATEGEEARRAEPVLDAGASTTFDEGRLGPVQAVMDPMSASEKRQAKIAEGFFRPKGIPTRQGMAKAPECLRMRIEP